LEFLQKAEEEELDVLVPLSIHDAAILSMFTRTGSWKTVGIDISDVFSLLLRLSEEGGAGI
jgi:hypothetical protein